MLPGELSGATKSHAEREMFTRIRSEGPDDWIALHSVGLTKHERKPVAEADFVLLTPDGILVLEVKGGAIARHGRVWTTNGKPLKESPFDQAGGAASALFNELKARIPSVGQSIVGYGVCFPDVTFRFEGADVPPELVYDHEDSFASFATYVKRVLAYWRERTRRAHVRPLSPADLDRVLEHLAGDFQLVPTLSDAVGTTTRQLVRATEDQARALSGLDANDRVLVMGAAGTGKTMLAIAEARRLAGEGRRVLLTCHSNALAEHMARQATDTPEISVFAFHRLLGHLIRLAGRHEVIPSDPGAKRRYFGSERPELALDAYASISSPPGWDAVIIDEAQDLLSGSAFDVLDVCITGGLERGIWRVFADPAQDVFSGSQDHVLDRLRALGVGYRLTTNCRNTSQIALQTAAASGTTMATVRPVAGPDVSWLRYADESERRRLIVDQLKTWKKEGLRGSQIVVLSENKLENGPLAGGLPRGSGFRLAEGPFVADEGCVRFCTVASFKGLDADAVLFIDPTLGAADRRSTVYVGMTRPRVVLALLRHTSTDETWERLKRDFAESTVGPVAP